MMQIQVVAIRRARSAVAEIFKRTLHLAENSEVRSGVKVSVNEITLEQKAVVIGGLLVEHRLAVEFIFEPCLAAKRQIDVRAVQRHKFYQV